MMRRRVVMMVMEMMMFSRSKQDGSMIVWDSEM